MLLVAVGLAVALLVSGCQNADEPVPEATNTEVQPEATSTKIEPEATSAEVEQNTAEPELPVAGLQPANAEIKLTAEGYPYLGSPDAPVKMYEFTDYFCGHCAYFALEKVPLLEEEYINAGKVQYIMQYYALGMDARLYVVEAGACAADQGRFFEYQRLLFSSQQELAETPIEQWGDLLLAYAQQVGLDVDAFGSCWEELGHQELIMASISDAREKGVSGTPAFLINGELIVGNQPYDVFKAAIDKALDEAN
jgi:protein-disulfide isomerase